MMPSWVIQDQSECLQNSAGNSGSLEVERQYVSTSGHAKIAINGGLNQPGRKFHHLVSDCSNLHLIQLEWIASALS